MALHIYRHASNSISSAPVIYSAELIMSSLTVRDMIGLSVDKAFASAASNSGLNRSSTASGMHCLQLIHLKNELQCSLSPFSWSVFGSGFGADFVRALYAPGKALPGAYKARTKSAPNPLKNTLHGKRALCVVLQSCGAQTQYVAAQTWWRCVRHREQWCL